MQRNTDGNCEESSGYVTTVVAAATLGVSERTIRNYAANGKLQSKRETEGIAERILIAVESLQRLRDERNSKRKKPQKDRRDSGREKDMSELVREFSARLETRASENAELRTRLELTAQAESTIREQLERERERADRLERELEQERGRGFWSRLFGR